MRTSFIFTIATAAVLISTPAFSGQAERISGTYHVVTLQQCVFVPKSANGSSNLTVQPGANGLEQVIQSTPGGGSSTSMRHSKFVFDQRRGTMRSLTASVSRLQTQQPFLGAALQQYADTTVSASLSIDKQRDELVLGDYEARWIQYDGSASTLRSAGGLRFVTFDGGKTFTTAQPTSPVMYIQSIAGATATYVYDVVCVGSTQGTRIKD
jgi:hypothetical protein